MNNSELNTNKISELNTNRVSELNDIIDSCEKIKTRIELLLSQREEIEKKLEQAKIELERSKAELNKKEEEVKNDMEKYLYIMDYKNRKYNTGIPVSEIKKIDVQVISGDEVVEVYFRNAVHRVDVSELNKIPRLYDYYDMSYSIDGNQISEWNRRKDTYDWPLWEEDEE